MPDREMIDTTRDKRYVRRDEQGEFKEVEEVGRSSAPTTSVATPRTTRERARATKATVKPGKGSRLAAR
jgi:hypothetical protein